MPSDSLTELFLAMKKAMPKGINLRRAEKRGKFHLSLQFRVGSKRVTKGCGCLWSEQGIRRAVLKAQLVSDALKRIESESEFWQWYEREILDKPDIRNDLIICQDAVTLLEQWFWRRTGKGGRKREKNSPSDQNIWHTTYGRFVFLLESQKSLTLQECQKVISRYEPGSQSYCNCIAALKCLCKVNRMDAIKRELDALDTRQTKRRDDLQTISLEGFLEMREKVLGIGYELHRNADLESRKDWMWVLSMQVVYGLRIHEVFAILNLHKPYRTKDGIMIPALCDRSSPNNLTNLIVIGELTEMGTTTKTGYRISAPIIPPSHPDLIERLGIKECRVPKNKPRKDSSPETIAKFYGQSIRQKLREWKCPITQTHALRHLANMNGRIAGMSIPALAQSLGHSEKMNETTYTKRQATATTIALLTQSNRQPVNPEQAFILIKECLEASFGLDSDTLTKRLVGLIYAIPLDGMILNREE